MVLEEKLGDVAKAKMKRVPGETSKKRSQVKKLSVDAAKLLQSLKEKINKKPFGRNVRDAEIISLGLSLITQDHVKALQERSLSGKDLQKMAYEDFQKANGKISFDDFLVKLVKGEISLKPSV